MSQFNRPNLPTTGDSPDEQRLRTGLGEIVRTLLDSGAFLNRLFPGRMQQRIVGTGTQVQLGWGSMNRLPAASVVTAFLPQVTPRQLGVPLVISKANATGIVLVQPAGVGSDGRTQPTVDGLATGFQFSEAGQRELMTDGVNWFTSQGGGARASVASGVFPPASSYRLPATYSPIGLWQFDGSLDDSSGLGQPKLVLERGFERYSPIVPGVLGVLCGGPTGAVFRLPHTGVATLLRKPGDIAIQMICQMTTETLTDAAGTSPVVGYRGSAVAVQNNNSLWGMYLGIENYPDWFTQSGAGTGFSAADGTVSLPPAGVRTVLWGARRKGNLVKFYIDGKPVSSGTATGTTPDGGASGLMRIGGQPQANETAAPYMVMTSLKVTAGSMSDAEFLADYNASLGQLYGSRS